MNRIFATAFMRFGKSKAMIVVCAIVIAALAATLIGLAVGNSQYNSPPDSGREGMTLYQGEYIPWQQFYEIRLQEDERRLVEDDELTEQQRFDLEMNIKGYRFYLETGTDRDDYYNSINEYGEGGAYWMQVLFLVGLFVSVLVPVGVTAWCFPGAKSGLLRTEFLAGRSRSEIWGGKTAASVVMSVAASVLFSLAMLVCAVCSHDVDFIVFDDMMASVSSISVFAAWAAESAAIVSAALLASALANCATRVSEDTATGATVAALIILVLTLGVFVVSNLLPADTTLSSDASVWMPFMGLGEMSKGTFNARIGLAVAAHFAVAAVLLAISRVIFGRRAL